jgi:signal transduction histidine kinase
MYHFRDAEETGRMRVQSKQWQSEPSHEELIGDLQRQVDELTAENKMLKTQLEQKEQFIAMVAHELRNLLTPIINYAQMIAQLAFPRQKAGEEEKPGRKLRRYSNIITSQSRRLGRLINDLLDASRLTSGQFTLVRKPCDIVALTKESIEYLIPVAPRNRIELQAPQESIRGIWDGERLQQVIGNLLDNAIKYSNPDTAIIVRIWRTPGEVHVSVRNEGIIIPKENIDQLFRPYTRLPASSGNRRGSGLGLYITKSIIEAHEGEMQLEPSTEAGTTFSFSLPLAPPA